jgi:outer membrane protein OmpA-like peptidoglycan-associated protein
MEQRVPLPIIAMRPLLLFSAVLLSAASPVLAQVTVDLHALQALPERPQGRPAARAAPPALTRVPSSATASTTPPAASVSATPAPVSPSLPESVPDTAMINPVMPPAPPAGSAPPPPPVSRDAATTAASIAAGLRLIFAPGQSDLSPDSNASIKALTAAAPPGDATTFNVLAYAPGTPDDPSTARRVSLSRAMAVRSALVAHGVPSARIFVRALGAQHGEGPPDRVDLSIEGVPIQGTQR